eukprot:7919280-Pyramimonas_sp.AAC.1
MGGAVHERARVLSREQHSWPHRLGEVTQVVRAGVHRDVSPRPAGEGCLLAPPEHLARIAANQDGTPETIVANQDGTPGTIVANQDGTPATIVADQDGTRGTMYWWMLSS